MNKVKITKQIKTLIDSGALFVLNHSAGKDSQAMTAALLKLIPHNQIVIIHASLPGMEWEGTREHILNTSLGIPYYEVTAVKTFMQMVDHRNMWPSPKYRQCTSDLKRGPIDKQVRKLAKDMGCNLIVSCMGMRAQESSNRSKLSTFTKNEKGSVAGRIWFNWLPIHHYTIDDVWAEIKEAGQEPHWVYAKGMTRLSCPFCIMASIGDMKIAKGLVPDLYNEIVKKEKETGHTFLMPKKGQSPKRLDEILTDPALR